MDHPVEQAQSPALLALKSEEPPMMLDAKGPGSLVSVRSGRDLINDADEPTVWVPQQLYAFLTTPEHSVTQALANSTVDMPVRIIAEHLFGLGYGSFGLWTGEQPAQRPAVNKESNAFKGVKGWLGKLSLGPKVKRGDSPKRKPTGDLKETEKEKQQRERQEREREKELITASSSRAVSPDEDDSENEHFRKMRPLTVAELNEVRRCGQWRGTQPSDLFLNIYAQTLLALEKNPLNGLVSPALMGTCGVAPLTIIAHSLDVVRHYADLIMRAEHEVFFTTNIWEASEAASIVADAIKKLSKRVIDNGQDKVVIKIMYDRGVADGGAHQRVSPKVYSSANVGLPAPEDVPGVILEVQNYHIPPVGSFHQKTVIIDREVALLSSNNVQNKEDVGFMAQLEGPIVQSMYDTAILSWWMSFRTPLPLLDRPPKYARSLEKLSSEDFVFGDAHSDIKVKGDLFTLAERAQQRLGPAVSPTVSVDSDIKSTQSNGSASVPFKPVTVHAPHDPFPVAMVNRTPRGRRGYGDAFVPQNQAWLAAFKFATKSVFLQTPTFSAKPIVTAALDAVRRGILVELYADIDFDEEGNISPDGKANQMVAAYMYSQLKPEERANLGVYWYTPKGATSPLRSPEASHTCHIKLMIVDEHIAVQGNGNADVSSWYHAQEINILVDSPQLCAEWREAIDACQDTRIHGRVGDDGVWRDKAGNRMPSAPAETPVRIPQMPVREPPVRDPRRTEPPREGTPPGRKSDHKRPSAPIRVKSDRK